MDSTSITRLLHCSLSCLFQPLSTQSNSLHSDGKYQWPVKRYLHSSAQRATSHGPVGIIKCLFWLHPNVGFGFMFLWHEVLAIKNPSILPGIRASKHFWCGRKSAAMDFSIFPRLETDFSCGHFCSMLLTSNRNVDKWKQALFNDFFFNITLENSNVKSCFCFSGCLRLVRLNGTCLLWHPQQCACSGRWHAFPFLSFPKNRGH